MSKLRGWLLIETRGSDPELASERRERLDEDSDEVGWIAERAVVTTVS